MNNNIKHITSVVFQKLKQNAKLIKKASNIPHHEALERSAMDIGFNNWHSVCIAYESYKLSKDAYESGAILAVEFKDSIELMGLKNDEITEDAAMIVNIIRDDYYQIFINSINPDDPKERTIKESETKEEINDWFEEHINEIMFFRINKDNISKKETLKLANKYFLFPPLFIFVNSQYFNTCSLPAKNNLGDIVGIRL